MSVLSKASILYSESNSGLLSTEDLEIESEYQTLLQRESSRSPTHCK